MRFSIHRTCVLLVLAVVCPFFTVHSGETICVPWCSGAGPSIQSRREFQALDHEILRRASGGSRFDGPAQFQPFNLTELAAAAKQFRPFQYGENDIDDPIDVSPLPHGVRANMDGVVAIMFRSQLNEDVNPIRLVANKPTAQTENLCPRERLRDQVAAVHCTGFLIDHDLVVTASHCAKSNNNVFRFVFGFVMTKDGPRREYSKDDVRHGEIAYRSDPCLQPERDFVVFQLVDANGDPSPVTHRPLTLASRMARPGEALYMLGFPLGTPLKYSRNAKVRPMVNDVFFKANLDGYDHNSGSPVFSKDHKVIGMHVRGVPALFTSCGCKKTTGCPNNGCDGEDATHLTKLPSIAAIRETICRVKNRECELPTGFCREPKPGAASLCLRPESGASARNTPM